MILKKESDTFNDIKFRVLHLIFKYTIEKTRISHDLKCT